MKKVILSLETAIKYRVATHFKRTFNEPSQVLKENDLIALAVKTNSGTYADYIAISLALIPHLHPDFLVQTINALLRSGEELNDICMTSGKKFTGLLPTGETLLFLLAGNDVNEKINYHYLFSDDHFLVKNNIIQLEAPDSGEPAFSGRLSISPDYFSFFTTGYFSHPKLSPEFPAQLLETDMEWDDLIIGDHTREQLKDLENWLSYYEQLAAHPELGKRTKKGYKTLFYGPPGTGKTLTASLLGKAAKRPVFRIDLSLLVSKYIGETEKNLSGIFKRAEHKNWILFFDEADALFGKRTETESSNDRFANQEVAYLLQRIENYNGMVILASNLKQNIDNAFIRRFQSMIYFPKPGKIERELIWKKTVPTDLPFEETIDLMRLTDAYELTASQISNIVQACYIDAVAGGEKCITQGILMKNLRLEFKKEDLLFEEIL